MSFVKYKLTQTSNTGIPYQTWRDTVSGLIFVGSPKFLGLELSTNSSVYEIISFSIFDEETCIAPCYLGPVTSGCLIVIIISIWPSVCQQILTLLITFFSLRDRAFIFGICVLYDKAFLMVQNLLNRWPWLWPLTYLKKNPLILTINIAQKEVSRWKYL